MHGFKEEEEGILSIKVIQTPHNIELTYKDNGKGLESQHREKIFEQYYTTKKGQGGTGLGLYIVKTIITEKLQGSIEIIDTKEGLGFKIIIPK